MTDETKEAVKADTYAQFRCKAVKCMRAMGVPDVDDSWDGMMKAVDYVKDHADREGEFSGAVMAAAMWVHGFCEQDSAAALERVEALISHEMEAANAKGEEDHAGAEGDAAAEAGQATTPASAPASM
jgi:hypothetical protein